MHPNDPYRSAVLSMPSSAQLGGAQPGVAPNQFQGQPGQQNPQVQYVPVPVVQQPPAWVRFPFFPTAPWYSTNPDVGYQVRDYSCGISSTESDFVVGSEAVRSIQFDLPVRVIVLNGAAFSNAADPIASGVNEQNMNLLYRIWFEYTIGDKLQTTPRLAATVLGTARNPGELGGHGYNIDQGGSLQVHITPLVDDIFIDITVRCLEMRAPRNFSVR